MKADDILKKHEDANEMHFHEVDRKWIIEAMEEYASLRQPTVVGSTDLGEEYYDDEYYENQPHENCPKCGRHYDRKIMKMAMQIFSLVGGGSIAYNL